MYHSFMSSSINFMRDSASFESIYVCGSDVVKLEGYSGCYAVDGLTVVENEVEQPWKDAMLSNFNRSK